MRESVEKKEKTYSTSEIAEMLNMGVTTVRKYAQFLEKSGYTFTKTKNNARLFLERDIKKIEHLKKLRENPTLTVEMATNIVLGRTKEDNIIKPLDSVVPEVKSIPEKQMNSSDLDELKSLINNQNDLISTLIQKLDQQQEIINEWLNERDKDLMRTISEKLETQKLIAATIEEEAPKKSFFGKFLKK